MVVYKRKKKVKFRASRSHGYGSHKKHRGAGHRGGRGRAGTGKRGDAKKTKIWKDAKYFGKYGFKSKGFQSIKSVNLNFIEDKFESLVEKRLISEKGGVYEIDVSKLGFNKVLGTGNLSRKLKIYAQNFSKSAIDKIKAAGGEAVVTGAQKKAKETELKDEKIKEKENSEDEKKEQQPLK